MITRCAVEIRKEKLERVEEDCLVGDGVCQLICSSGWSVRKGSGDLLLHFCAAEDFDLGNERFRVDVSLVLSLEGNTLVLSHNKQNQNDFKGNNHKHAIHLHPNFDRNSWHLPRARHDSIPSMLSSILHPFVSISPGQSEH